MTDTPASTDCTKVVLRSRKASIQPSRRSFEIIAALLLRNPLRQRMSVQRFNIPCESEFASGPNSTPPSLSLDTPAADPHFSVHFSVGDAPQRRGLMVLCSHPGTTSVTI